MNSRENSKAIQVDKSQVLAGAKREEEWQEMKPRVKKTDYRGHRYHCLV